MKQLKKRFLAVMLCLTMIVSILPQSVAYAAETTDTDEYQIYPTPHEVTYQDGTYEIGSDVNVVYEAAIDEATKNRMNEVLSIKDVTAEVTAEKQDGKTNILVGIYGSKGYVDTYAQERYTIDETLFAHYASHYVISANNEIIVLALDTDAAFYGITSLKHIFHQMNGKTIRNFTIKDYADTNNRGFIEGYYGLPWSNEDRMSLMEFGGDFKMTSYIFAPKDDPYHRELWRTLYPADELAEIKEMVELGNSVKCRFVWTAHPFLGGFNGNDVQGEINSLLAKFDQLYGIGVRQFGVLADDAGSIDYSVLIQIMTAVSDWAAEKGDVYDSVFCPAGYNHSWQGNYNELNALDKEFPEDVQIFWTGEAVCQPVEQKTLDHFRRNIVNEDGKTERRAPLFWLNWPVNDINSARMLMGKGSLLQTDIKVEDLAGVITNPMQEAEASKVAIFAVADYAWNVAGFDDDKSWEDSFAYIEPDASEDLFTLAKHMSDPSPNGHGLVLGESDDLQPLLDSYKDKLKAGTLTDADHTDMIKEFQVIADACDNFQEKSKNEDLKEELEPFTASLKEKCLAAIEFIKTQQAVEDADEDAAWTHYSQATAYLASSKKHVKTLKDGTTFVTPGSKRLTPFVENLNTTLAPIVSAMIDETKVLTTYITNRTDAPATGSVENIMDGDVASSAIYKTPNQIVKDDYVGVKYTKAIDIENIRFVLGAGKDHFDQGKLQYTEDGKTWKDLELVGMNNLFTGVQGQVQDVNVAKENLPENLKAMGIRFIATKNNQADAWLEVREIMINAKDEQGAGAAEVYEGSLFVPNGFTVYQGSEANVKDGSDSTFIWYRTPNDTVTEGQYVGFDLGSAKAIGAIHFAMPSGDCLSNYTLQYSADGTNYTNIATFTTLTADVDLSNQNITARYIRVLNNANTGKWLKVASFSVSEPVIVETEIFTNKETVSGFANNLTENTAVLTGSKEVTYAPGEYVGIQLDRIKDISEITAAGAGTLTLETSKNNVVWTAVKGNDYEDARYIRLINNTKSAVKATVTSLTVKSNEIQAVSVAATNFGSASTHLNAFDNDRTTEAVLQASQLKGQYITYDLGQVIELDSLKLVLHDGTTDYPRHAKVSVSADGSNWSEVLVIGNQNANNTGEVENTDNIADLFPEHEISYYTLEAKEIGKSIRFIKFEITRNKAGADKWVRIREIELNGGNMYLPEKNDPTIVTTAAEAKGNAAFNINDGDLSTTFQPTDGKAGSLTYYLSEKTNVEKINILQSPSVLSGAKVSAEVVEGGAVKTVELGNLSLSFNKLNTAAYDHVLSITITWEEGKAPCIHEIITIANKEVVPEEKDPVTDVFTDVVAGLWYVDAVQYVYNTGLMSGFQDQFTPNANMSRAMVVTTLYRMEGSPKVTDYSAYLAFKDVKVGDWYADAVAWALNNDIATGDPINQKFNPNANVTREQLAAFLYRYTEFKGGSVTERGDFSDMKNADKVSSWALKEMQWAVGTELISGIVEVKGEQIVARDLAPQGNATRAQMATILQRYCTMK